MRLTTKGRYAVTAMMDLALHESRGPVTLTDIAANQSISLSYLEQLFARLRRNGLVRGLRGPGGGYRLGRAAGEITIAQIIHAVDEKVDATRCEGRENCRDGERCITHDLWDELSRRMQSFLDGITLADVVEWPCVREVAERQDAASATSTEVQPARSNAA
jgi:Rrf2 family transcriptional regulator, iron-sulfur cluster assembly transcription factor